MSRQRGCGRQQRNTWSLRVVPNISGDLACAIAWLRRSKRVAWCFIMSMQRPGQPIELQADAVVQLDAIERSDGVIRGMLARVLPSMFGTGYVLHLRVMGHRETRSICSISSTSTQRAARCMS